MSAGRPILEPVIRSDGKFDWHLKVNGRVVATSGTQGYERKHRAMQMGRRVCSGSYEFDESAEPVFSDDD